MADRSGRLALAGFLAIAVAFGPARNGYGLFLPDIRREFGFSIELSGFVASASYAGYLLALTAVGLLATRVGPRPLVMIGGLSAGLGMALVALAPNAVVLAIGVILAATNAGWSWAPYNDAADRMVPARLRGRVLSIISTGTTFGILAAGLVALTAGGSWRLGWLAFAAAAVVAAAYNAWLLPSGPRASGGGGSTHWPGWSWFVCAESTSLYVAAFSFGAVSAVYWAFAVDLIANAGDLPAAAGPLLYVAIGVAGFAGLFTGDAAVRFGLRRVLVTILASLGAATFLLGAAPAWWPAVGISAVLYGASVMCMSALLAVWSSVVFSEQPATGFSAALLLFAVGNIVGPAAAGAFAGRFGLDTAFFLSAALALVGIIIPPRVEASPRSEIGIGHE